MSNPLAEYKPAKLLLAPGAGGAGRPRAVGLNTSVGACAGGRLCERVGIL